MFLGSTLCKGGKQVCRQRKGVLCIIKSTADPERTWGWVGPSQLSRVELRGQAFTLHHYWELLKKTPSWITALSWWRGLHTSMKWWAMQRRATQDGWVIGESADKTCSIGGENGKPLQHSCPENPMDSTKRQKSMDMNLSKLQESGGQRSLACCSPWGCKGSDMT